VVLATFVIGRTWAALIALGAIVVPLWLVRQMVTVPSSPGDNLAQRRRRRLGALVIGTDGRASTSKMQAVLWTFAVLYAIAFMLLWGRSLGCGDAARKAQAICQAASGARAVFTDFVNRGLQPEYFVLLGFPVGAAVAAKAIKSAQVSEIADPHQDDLTSGDGGVAQSVREIISNDDNETDLLDFQYFVFNLVTLAFFFSSFLTSPSGGLPDLPPTLIALSGLSASAYVAKKGLVAAGVKKNEGDPTKTTAKTTGRKAT
jgi:hypothetical protein